MQPRLTHFSNVPCPQMPLAGLQAIRIEPSLTIAFDASDSAILSLTVATDMRGECHANLEDDHGAVYAINAQYSSHAERLHVPLKDNVRELRVMDVSGDAELWVVNEPPLAPELIAANAALPRRRDLALERLRENSICQFSWMGGCALDGLWQLHQRQPGNRWDRAIDAWLAHFTRDGDLLYQSPRGEEVRNAFHGIESTLPVAIIAQRDPHNRALDYAVDEWRRMTKPNGVITDHSITAEGCYTAAYPMAVVGKLRNDQALIEAALAQLRIRRDKLCIDGDLYLRNLDGKLSFRNWTRGICWSLLGLARTLQSLGADADAGLAEFATERGQWIITRQRADGLWDNFLDEAGQGFPPDSSGSSGIAAALMAFRELGLIGDEARAAAKRCWEGLGACLEPDGFLGSVAPNNKRGETEQHTHRRTIEPFALGLYGQLAAALLP